MKTILLLIIIFATQAFAITPQKSIVTSISPIASITAMLLQNNAAIHSLASGNQCPHHYHAKPSDLAKVLSADLVIYIDEEFDGFAAKIMRGNPNQIRVSSLKSLKLIINRQLPNWHFWLDIANTNILLEELAKIFILKFPELEESINSNLANTKHKLAILSKEVDESIKSLDSMLILDESLEYLFLNATAAHKFLVPKFKSLKYITQLEQSVNKTQAKCIIISFAQPAQQFSRFAVSVIQLESENWVMPADGSPLSELYFQKYEQILESLKPCLSRGNVIPAKAHRRKY